MSIELHCIKLVQIQKLSTVSAIAETNIDLIGLTQN